MKEVHTLATPTIDPILAGRIWKRYEIRSNVEKFQPFVKVHRNDKNEVTSIFLGFGDLNLIGDLGEHLKLRKLQIKMLGGGTAPFIDFPSELIKNQDGTPRLDSQGRPQYPPFYLSKTPETRAVLTELVFRDTAVKVALEEAIRMVASFDALVTGPTGTGETPFGGTADEGEDGTDHGPNPFDEAAAGVGA